MLSRYRWLVLAAGTAAQTSFSAVIIGLPVLAPQLRDAHGLSLLQVGVVLDSLWIGTLLTLLPWGLLADRVGERLVLGTGLGACGIATAAAGSASSFESLVLLVGLAGAAGASVNAASGRAVMQWFPATERGFALGVRQTAIPVGGLISALVLPTLSLRSAFVFLGVLCLAGAAFGVAAIRDRKGGVEDDVLEPRGLGATLRDHRLWLLCAGSSFYLVAQLALISFMVLFLHDERGFSDGAAAGVLAAAQVVAAVMRIGGGRWSDRIGSRLRRCGSVGVASAATLAVASAVLSAPLALLVPAFVRGRWDLDGLERALVHGRRRDRRPQPQRRSARDAAERLPRRARSCRRPSPRWSPRARGGSGSPVQPSSRSQASCCCGRCGLRLWACGFWSGSTGCMRSAAGRARTASAGPARRTRPTSSSAGWMREAGLDGRRRRGGQPLRPPRARPERRVWTGSHLDTVPHGGRFDGALGVVAGHRGARAARQRELPLAVVAFRAEERGPLPGARCLDGRLPAAFLELHIEQGPQLRAAGAPLGVVTGIAGQARGSVSSRAAPATPGTTPMAERDDALVAGGRVRPARAATRARGRRRRDGRARSRSSRRDERGPGAGDGVGRRARARRAARLERAHRRDRLRADVARRSPSR